MSSIGVPLSLLDAQDKFLNVGIERLEVQVDALRRVVCESCCDGHPVRRDGQHEYRGVVWSCPASDAINEALATRKAEQEARPATTTTGRT